MGQLGRRAKTICVDSKGNVCMTGKEFMHADENGFFPIKVYEVGL